LLVAGQQLGAELLGRRVDDRVCCGQLVLAVQLGSQQRDCGVKGHHPAFLRVGDHLIGLLLPQLSHQPLRQLELHDGGHDAVGLVRDLLAQLLTQRAAHQPLDPGRGVDHPRHGRHQ